MDQRTVFSELERIVLLAILRMGEDAYGVTIYAEIQTRTGRNPTPGALYLMLDRLEDRGLVASRMADPTPQRSGRAKRFFKVTDTGLAAVFCAPPSCPSNFPALQIPGLSNA